VVGVECLARWEHPAHGEVAPDEFVAIAEHTGELGRITELVFREGLHRARGWLDQGRELPVAMNVSPRTVVDPTFPRRLASLLDEFTASPSARWPTCGNWRMWAYGSRWTILGQDTHRSRSCAGCHCTR
jgi:EAL domain-containing protein (putative c-di-GMP-specific phosphodiesterase class I)